MSFTLSPRILVIKLKNCPENLIMLNLIASDIGGNVRLVDKDKFVIWVVNNKKYIQKIKNYMLKFLKYVLIKLRTVRTSLISLELYVFFCFFLCPLIYLLFFYLKPLQRLNKVV